MGSDAALGMSHDWPTTAAEARALQDTIGKHVVVAPLGDTPIRYVAGVDIGFEDRGETTRAAIVVFDADTRASAGSFPLIETDTDASSIDASSPIARAATAAAVAVE